MNTAEYIWVDGAEPTQKLRSKTRVLSLSGDVTLESFPVWNFDGSSTGQSGTDNSDCIMRPVSFVRDPIRGGDNYLVMTEVFTGDGTAHSSNRRAELRKTLDEGASEAQSWFGFEQEYTLFKGRDPLGWPKGGYPAPQGPFYCGVGADEVFGRELAEKHLQACISAGIMIYGVNAEVMPGQWEYQIGHRGFQGETADPLTVSDHLWLSRWLLYRLGEESGVSATLDPKPVKGDWNGAGLHTNFSTTASRSKESGSAFIDMAVAALEANHARHIASYGHGIEDRLTGKHETCDASEFRAGNSDRGASIRIPLHVSVAGCGYLEDRRPCANADPYVVCTRLLETVVLGK